MEKLGFDVVGYGCMTCIGNSGPIEENIANTIEKVIKKYFILQKCCSYKLNSLSERISLLRRSFRQ